MLLRIIYQVCFILRRISLFPCKQHYTVILSAETLGRGVCFGFQQFPLITFYRCYRLQDSCMKVGFQTRPGMQLCKELQDQDAAPGEIPDLLSRNTLRSRTWQRELFSNSGFYMPRFQPLSPNTYEKRMKSLAHVAFSGSVMSSAERNESERRKEDMLVLLRDERSSLCRDGTVVHEQNFSFICFSGKPGNLSSFTFLKIIIINLKKMWRPTPQTKEALYWTQLTFVLAFGDWVSWL